MASTLKTARFLIFHRDKDGVPDYIFPWYGAVATYVVASINVCRGILTQSSAQYHFAQMAKEYRLKDAETWFHGRKSDSLAGDFIDKILRDFPLVFVDDSLSHPDFLAHGYRQFWNQSFVSHDQAIVLNGPRIRDMCRAARIAQKAGHPNHDAIKRYQGFMFLFTNVLMHELGHIFMTYLTQGYANTPPSMFGKAPGVSQGARGEAGRYLEQNLFGACLGSYRDTAQDDGQPGVPHLLKNNAFYPILRDSITETLEHRNKFEEGYKHRNTPLKSTPPTMGYHLPRPYPYPPSDPTARPQTQKLRESSGGGQSLLVGPKSTLHRIPMDPSLRVQIPLDPELDAQAAGSGNSQAGGSVRNDSDFWDKWIDES